MNKPQMDANKRKWKFGYLAAICLALPIALPIAACASFKDEPRVPGPGSRTIEDEIIYLVMPDRFANGDPSNDTGGINGERARHGFDPTDKGFYHGGDLEGLTSKLDYIAGLGATAIWVTPVFVNKPVQGPAGDLSAAYHGYWITDFTDIDPHLGSREDFGEFVRRAHERGLKVILDIVVNHTADVIGYRECSILDPATGISWSECPYRSVDDYPWTTRGDENGERINEGFRGDAPRFQTEENFSRLTDPDWAYTVVVPNDEPKSPDWLNDPLHYHNRGNSHWEGESVFYGDFSGLDDVNTEHPRVIQGMIELYRSWITDFRIDGFRIDTAKHVNDAFWQAFNPAILEHARELGIDDFYIFGEAYELEPRRLARFTREAAFPAVIDFAFREAVRAIVTGADGPRVLERVFDRDRRYRNARIVPTPIGDHDNGRIGFRLIEAFGRETGDHELLDRSILAHALMLFARGVPVVYYGDEQGFTGDGGDKDAREDMFPSRVASYNDNRLIGTGATTADDNFDRDHPLYRAIAEMSALRAAEPALRRGEQQVLAADHRPGLFALSRRQGDREVVIAFNTGNQRIEREFRPAAGRRDWRVLHSRGLAEWRSRGRDLEAVLEPLSFAVFAPQDKGRTE